MVPARTVVTPPASSLLISRDSVKADLGITGTGSDAQLDRYIAWASSRIAQYCGRDSFGAQTVRDRWNLARYTGPLLLPVRPVTAIGAVTEDGEALTSADYRLDNAQLLQRVQDGEDIDWPPVVVEVTYTGGYTLPASADPVLAEAAARLVAARWLARDRDPALRSESVDGVTSASYLDPRPGAGGLPEDVARDLTNFRNFSFG